MSALSSAISVRYSGTPFILMFKLVQVLFSFSSLAMRFFVIDIYPFSNRYRDPVTKITFFALVLVILNSMLEGLLSVKNDS